MRVENENFVLVGSLNTVSLVYMTEYYQKPKWYTHPCSKNTFTKQNFTQVLMILHKRCLWCLWQISCLMWNCSHMMIGQDCANSFPPWWMSLWCGPWTLPWPWPRTLINCHCHWLAKDLSCETWSQILTFSRSCLVVRHVRFQKLIHVPTMWTFCSYLFLDIFVWWLKQDEHSTKDIFSETQLCC